MASTWAVSKAELKDRFDSLNQVNIEGKIAELNTAVAKYISKGGLSQDSSSNADLIDISEKLEELNKIKESYNNLYSYINTFLKTNASQNSLSDALTKNGTLKTTIQQLTKTRDGMKTDVESAVAREELLRSRETDMTRHELFLFGRPVRRGIIPYLWLLSVLFIGIGLCVFYMAGQTLGLKEYVYEASIMGMMYYAITDFFTNPTVLYSIIGALIIVILALALKITGVFERK